DAGIVSIEGLTAVFGGPASLLAVYAIATGKSYSHILQFAISLAQLYGVGVYYITALLEGVPRVTITNQEDNITQQLHNGVRGLMLDMYDFDGDVWLCHSSRGQCHDYTAFEPAINTLKEIEAFLSANPSEIVTLILEDYVHTQNGLKKVFSDSGLMKFWFPVTNMPRNGRDWPLVSDM
ncbi:hypothetical protein PIB30_107100, partial [Stylosanthes scabra]|nr:hypothetical protein [Stylosanthes scabra]